MVLRRLAQEVKPRQVIAPHALQALGRQRVEEPYARPELARALADPAPGAHLQRKRHEQPRALCGLFAQVVPQVPVSEIAPALRLEEIGMRGLCLVEERHQGVYFGQVREWLAGMGVGKPDPIAQPEPGMAVERDARSEERRVGKAWRLRAEKVYLMT